MEPKHSRSKPLRVWRAERGITQKALAAMAKVHPVDYSRYETGKVIPSGPTLQRIARALQIDANDIDLDPGSSDVVAA